MVRRQHQQQRIITLAGCFQRGHRDRRGGVAANRLQQDCLRLHAQLLQLLGGDEAVLLVGDDQRRAAGDRCHTLPGGLQHGLFAGQCQELLGVGLARQWPQAGAGAAGKDDGKKVLHGGGTRLRRP